MQSSLTAAGVGTGIHYPVPLHVQRAYRDLGYQQRRPAGYGASLCRNSLAANVSAAERFPAGQGCSCAEGLSRVGRQRLLIEAFLKSEAMAQFRADRLLTLYAAQPARRLMPLGPGRVPILMYHSISRNREASTSLFSDCYQPGDLRATVEFLHQNGYKTVTLSDAIGRMQTWQASEQTVVITFDDGYRDFYTEAFPVLNRHSYSATVFLPTAYIGESPRKFNGRECLTWSQVRELKTAGIDFGSHTVTHPQLKI